MCCSRKSASRTTPNASIYSRVSNTSRRSPRLIRNRKCQRWCATTVRVLTEFPAIAYWLAKTNPSANLLPDDVEAQVKALELTDYAVATIHMQGFGRQFRPSNFTPSAADEEAVKTRGKEIAEKGFGLLDKALEGKDYAVGKFSIADSAIFYVEFWSKRVGLPLPANCAAHLDRMLGRPAVQRVLQQEGLA